jgi:uncharacterized membrane protein YdjX (TVP38/TMEM64 family)
MSDRASGPTDNGHSPPAVRRAIMIVLMAAALAVIASSSDLHGWIVGLLPTVETMIRNRPRAGAAIFVAAAALSAMLAFVSSVVIVPVGIYVWGKTVSMVLLWVGWILGGMCAYTIGRYFGRPVVEALTSGPMLKRYEHSVSQRAPFGLVLMFQLALPSEVPGYLLGLARYRFWKYLAALALAELPYAVATIYLGASFIERRTYMLVGLGIGVAAFSGWALFTLHRRVARKGGRH